MSDTNSQIPLFVDLDGTLIKTDLLFESLFLLLKRNLLLLFLIPIWLLGGRARLKAELAQRVNIAANLLPLNPDFLEYLKSEKQKGRRLILISASNQQAVEQVGNEVGLFEESIGSDKQINLKSHAKLTHIKTLVSDGAFAYAGNSSADLPIWEQAAEVIRVNCAAALGEGLGNRTSHVFDAPKPWAQQLWRAMRPHQWLKNGLLFVPLILAHQVNDTALLLQALIGFLCFSLCASSVYLLNDLLDLEADRQHASKRERPFAAGTLPIQVGTLVAPALLALALLMALALPADFLAILISYWLLTLLYSLYLKRVFLLDVVTLSVLYTTRLLAGAAAVAVLASPWLLAFSTAIFLSLGLVKRVTEITAANNDSAEAIEKLPGRAYQATQKSMLSWLGIGAGLLAVVVFALYIYAPETSVLYTSPLLLWPNCGLLLFLLWRLWRIALAGKLQDDPVLFAISDHPSQLVTALMFVVLWLAI